MSPADNTPAEALEDFKCLKPRKIYAEELGVSVRTVMRIEERDPDFPTVIYQNGRAHVTDTAFDRPPLTGPLRMLVH